MPIREEKMEMKEMLCADFDATFDRLCEEKLLTWFPLIGKNYPSAAKRIFMLWESHYANEIPDGEEDDEEFTRNVFYKNAILGIIRNPAFENALEILGISTDRKDLEKFFSNIACCNVIQNIMPNSQKRPTRAQFLAGCRAFSKLRQILKPDVCIFWGVTVCNTLHSFSDDQGDFGTVESCLDEKIGGCYPRYGELPDGTKIVGVRHPSRCNGEDVQDEWRTWIFREIPELDLVIEHTR